MMFYFIIIIFPLSSLLLNIINILHASVGRTRRYSKRIPFQHGVARAA